MTKPLLIGHLKYLNVAPFYYQLRKYLKENNIDDVKFVSGVPASLYDMFISGQLSMALLSSAMFSTLSEHINIIGTGISSTGKVESVLLFTKVPLTEKLPFRIAVTSQSKTSVALLQILLNNHLSLGLAPPLSNQEPVFIKTDSPMMELDRGIEGALLIGDEALKILIEIEAGSLYNDLVVTDLGELWHIMTGLPMVWATWFAHAGIDKEMSLKIKDILLDLSDISKDELMHLAEIESKKRSIPVSRIISYWQLFRYKFDNKTISGCDKFLEYVIGTNIKFGAFI